MPLRTVFFNPLATREFQKAYRWYFRRSPGTAQRFQLAMNHVVQRIAVSAEQGTPYRQYYRWMRLKRFPYLIYYEIKDLKSVLVYAVANARRRPGYWIRRRQP